MHVADVSRQRVRLTLKAAGLAAIAIGVLLAIAVPTLDAWKWHRYDLATASEYAYTFTPPPPPLAEVVVRWAFLLFVCCGVGLAWAAAVVLPALFAVRRWVSHPVMNKLVAAAVVFVISAIAFSALQIPNHFLPAAIVFSAGGAIGLAGMAVAIWVLPPHGAQLKR